MDLHNLPAVERVIIVADQLAAGKYPRQLLAETAKEVVCDLRREVMAGRCPATNPQLLLTRAAEMTRNVCREKLQPGLRRVVNATGIPLHTNLGRAPLAVEAVVAITDVAGGYCNLELDVASGTRGHRMGCAENLICALTGAADACFVNNNAAAVLLALNTLAEGQEVIVSRGQLVEIGGSFRVPDIMAKSGAILREVGATNKTHLADYCQAITAQTALLLAVHQSNFSQLGFVAQVELASLVELARQRKLSVMCDLGSGCLYPFAEQGVGCEPLITQVLAAGVDIVTVSGDKLLGGPQCGIILGDRHKIQQIKENPFYRAFRLDKLTIAAVEATLLLYRSGHSERIPLIAMVTAIPQVLQERAERLRQLVADCPGLYAKTVETEAEIGGGSMPGVKLSGYAVAINHNRYSAAVLAGELRQNQPAIIAYIRNEQVMLDIRTVMDEEIQLIAQALFKICREGVD